MADGDLAGLRIDKDKMPVRRGKRRRVVLLVAGVLLLFALGMLYKAGVLTPALEVRVAAVENIYPYQTFTLLNASGYVVAQRKAAVASKITGRLVFLGVEEGDRVKKGRVIARLEDRDAQAACRRAAANVEVARSALKQAQAEWINARLAYRRAGKLLSSGHIARADFDAAEARYRVAEAAVAARKAALRAAEAARAEAEVMLDYTRIRAPFDGVVLTKNADIGDIVTPLGAAANAKAAVVTLADMDSLQVEADVSESEIRRVRVGQPCVIHLDALPDKRFPGRVHRIVPTADRSKASVLVKVAFLDKDPGILPEMSAKVAFLSREAGPKDRIYVKSVFASAVFQKNGEDRVYRVRNGRAEETRVRLGRRFGETDEVLDGLALGDLVIVSPLDRVRNGIRVQARQE